MKLLLQTGLENTHTYQVEVVILIQQLIFVTNLQGNSSKREESAIRSWELKGRGFNFVGCGPLIRSNFFAVQIRGGWKRE